MTIETPSENGITRIYPSRKVEDLSSISEAELAQSAGAVIVETWSSRLIRARKAARMTQEALETVSGVKRSLIAAYEKGAVVEANADKLQRLARALNVSIEYLLTGDGDAAPAEPIRITDAPALRGLDARSVIRDVLKRLRALERGLEDWLDDNASD